MAQGRDPRDHMNDKINKGYINPIEWLRTTPKSTPKNEVDKLKRFQADDPARKQPSLKAAILSVSSKLSSLFHSRLKGIYEVNLYQEKIVKKEQLMAKLDDACSEGSTRTKCKLVLKEIQNSLNGFSEKFPDLRHDAESFQICIRGICRSAQDVIVKRSNVRPSHTRLLVPDEVIRDATFRLGDILNTYTYFLDREFHISDYDERTKHMTSLCDQLKVALSDETVEKEILQELLEEIKQTTNGLELDGYFSELATLVSAWILAAQHTPS